jgi:hypothetical protein
MISDTLETAVFEPDSAQFIIPGYDGFSSEPLRLRITVVHRPDRRYVGHFTYSE